MFKFCAFIQICVFPTNYHLANNFGLSECNRVKVNMQFWPF